MHTRLLRTAAGLVLAAVLLSVPVCAEPSVSAVSAVLMDGRTGRILWEKNGSERSLIASTTKIMTGLLIVEDCDLSAEVAVPPEAEGMEGSSMYLRAGEILTVEQLLYGMMLHSGNDAAVTLAMYHSGSLECFSEKMNEKAQQLGLKNTHFSNPHGLDSEKNYSTAADLGKLTAYAMENTVFCQIVSTKQISFDRWSLTNHNKLLWRYEGAVGVKTGYTKAAGRILVSAAERNGRRLIAVTIHDPNDWADHAALLDYGFSAFEDQLLAEAGQIMASVPVLCGAEKYISAVVREAVLVPAAQEETLEIRVNVPPLVFAPVMAGETAGSVEVLADDVVIAEHPLYWRYSVLEEA